MTGFYPCPPPNQNRPYSTSPRQRLGTNNPSSYARPSYAVPRVMSASNDFHRPGGSASVNNNSSEPIYSETDPPFFQFTHDFSSAFPNHPDPRLRSPSTQSRPPDIQIDTSRANNRPGQPQYMPSQQFSMSDWTSTPPAMPNYALTSYETNHSQYSYPNLLSTQAPQAPSRRVSPSSATDIMIQPDYPVHIQPNTSLSPPTTPASQGHSHMSSSSGAPSPVLHLSQQVAVNTPGNKRLYTHREQLQLFRDAFNLPLSGAGPFIQQQMYKPHTNSDRRRYVEEVDLEEPIHFWTENPTECGILLSDALHSRVRRLMYRDETVFEGRGPSVSIRLEWPGYRQWSRQIPTKDFRSPPGPITRAKLAKNVAKCVQRFISERQSLPMEDDADARWRVGSGPNRIQLDDLILVSIHHVSMGSWQPHLRLRRPFQS